MKEIKLTQGKVALVDDDMFEILSKFKWYAIKNGNTFYARKRYKKNMLLLHHYIIGFPLKGFEVDHQDGNGLNNLRNNLRIITNRGNGQNKVNINKTSIYPGVCWKKKNKKWCSQINLKGQVKHLGLFITEQEAFQAYTQACENIGEPCSISTEKQRLTQYLPLPTK